MKVCSVPVSIFKLSGHVDLTFVFIQSCVVGQDSELVYNIPVSVCY